MCQEEEQFKGLWVGAGVGGGGGIKRFCCLYEQQKIEELPIENDDY